jgi:hypothetical protein
MEPDMLVPDAPRRSPLLPLLLAGGALGVVVLLLVAAIGIPLFLGARERARAREPLREPAAVAGLPRVRVPAVAAQERLGLEAARRGGYGNVLVATFGTAGGGDAVLVMAVRSASEQAREAWVPGQRADLARAFPSQGAERLFGQGELPLTCAPVRGDPLDPVAWCGWSDDDTAGFTVGYGRFGPERLAAASAEAWTAIADP